MKNLLFAVKYTIGWLITLTSLAACASFELVQEGKPVADSDIIETRWRKEVPPGGQFDVIGLHRFRDPGSKAIATMLYLPGTNMNGELAVTDEDYNLWLYLAARGIVVYTLDYRTHAVPNDYNGSFEFMKDWHLSRFTDDAGLALQQIKRDTGSLPVFVAGFSRGVTFAYALAGRARPDGLVVLDGGFKDFQSQEFDRETALKELHKRKHYASILSRSRGWENRQELMRRVYADPDSEPLDDKYRSAGEQLSATLYEAWGPGGLANTRDDISSIITLARLMAGYDRFYPMIQNIEGRSLASYPDDPATDLDNHFGRMSVPILYFGSTRLGTDHLLNGIYSAGYSGSRDVTIHVLENFGHIDVLVARDAKSQVYDVILEWIRSRQ